jgi:hypothetical protein
MWVGDQTTEHKTQLDVSLGIVVGAMQSKPSMHGDVRNRISRSRVRAWGYGMIKREQTSPERLAMARGLWVNEMEKLSGDFGVQCEGSSQETPCCFERVAQPKLPPSLSVSIRPAKDGTGRAGGRGPQRNKRQPAKY